VQIWATIYVGETQKRANDLAAQANEVAAASARTAFATLCNTLLVNTLRLVFSAC
jgi:hypothetical protein